MEREWLVVNYNCFGSHCNSTHTWASIFNSFQWKLARISIRFVGALHPIFTNFNVSHVTKDAAHQLVPRAAQLYWNLEFILRASAVSIFSYSQLCNAIGKCCVIIHSVFNILFFFFCLNDLCDYRPTWINIKESIRSVWLEVMSNVRMRISDVKHVQENGENGE